MRFTSIIALVFATGAIAAPTLESRQSQCSADNQNYVDNLTCPALQSITGLLGFQGDSVGGFSRDALLELNKVLASDDPVSTIGKDAFAGAVQGVTQSTVFFLKGLASTLSVVNPACKCNMVACNNDILDSQGQCNIAPSSGMLPSSTSQSCGQTLYQCAGFYSVDQINQMTGCCDRFAGVTNP